MAQLPPDGNYLIHQIDNKVVVFQRHTEKEIVSFDPLNGVELSKAQKTIHESDLSEETKCFAHFWCGYFYAHAVMQQRTRFDQTI